MTVTTAEARDEMLAVVNEAWLAAAASQDLPVLWPDRSQEVPDSGAWARVNLQHVTGRQSTLRGTTGERRFRRTGILSVQIFTPHGEGLTLSDTLAKIVTDALEGVTTSGGVSFLNVVPVEVGVSGQWFQKNVLADFDYDEVR